MFCEVERSYIEDGFNLYGLRTCVSNFSDCLDLILDRIGPDDSDDSHLTQSACTLYGLIHARFIITAHGLDAMYNKYAAKEFGTCPLVQCAGQPVLPVGLKDEMGADTVKIFCPKCQCVYHPPPVRSRSSHHGGAGAAGVDGAAFGTTFPHLFLMTFSNLVPDPLPQDSAYVPRVFGFRVHMSARQRASGGSNAMSSGAAATRQQQQQQQQQPDNTNNNNNNNNKRASIAGRRSAESLSNHVAVEDAQATKGGRKSLGATNINNNINSTKPGSYNNNDDKSVVDSNNNDTTSGNKKTKLGKRKNDNNNNNTETGSGGGTKKSNGDSSTSSKRRRKSEN